MAYRFDGVECDTFEELQRLQGSARTTSAVIKEKRKTGCIFDNCTNPKCTPRAHCHDSSDTLSEREVERHNAQVECDKGPDA